MKDQPVRFALYFVRLVDVDNNPFDYRIVATNAHLAYSQAVSLATSGGIRHPEVVDVRLTHRIDAIC